MPDLGKIVYVQGGCATNGDGSFDFPYNSLSATQSDLTWKTLKVRYSHAPLDGGILLRDGQNLIGDSEFRCKTGEVKPLIINTQPESNGGNGVLVESGSVFIENIAFDNTYASAVECSNAVNITIRHCLITGWNQGELVGTVLNSELLPEYSRQFTIPSIFCNSITPGMTKLCSVVIRAGHTGPGVLQFANGVSRGLDIENCNIRAINSIIPTTSTLLRINGSIGVATMSVNIGGHQDVTITRTVFRDFIKNDMAGLNPLETQPLNVGYSSFPAFGATTNTVIKNCIFKNIPPNQNSYSICINLPTVHNDCSQTATISNNIFDNSDSQPAFDYTGIAIDVFSGISDITIHGNIFINVLSVVNISRGSAQTNIIVTNNTSSSVFSFMLISTSADTYHQARYGMLPPSEPQAIFSITDNKFNGANINAVGLPTDSGTGAGAIVILKTFTNPKNPTDPDFPISTPAPWQSLQVTLTDNCFNSVIENDPVVSSGVALLSMSSSGSLTVSPGNAIVTAHNNNFENYAISILDSVATGIDYQVQGNYWSPLNFVVTFPPTTVDNSSELNNPIECFSGCY